MSLQHARGSFFESLDGPLVLSRMTGPRTDVREAEFLEELSDSQNLSAMTRLRSSRRQRTTPSFTDPDPPRRSARTEPVASAERRGLGPSVQLSTRPSGPLKRWTQSRSVWRSIPPIFAAEPRSMPSRTEPATEAAGSGSAGQWRQSCWFDDVLGDHPRTRCRAPSQGCHRTRAGALLATSGCNAKEESLLALATVAGGVPAEALEKTARLERP